MITVLSGMSTLEQMRDNIRAMGSITPLSGREREALSGAVQIYRDSAPIPTGVVGKYKGLTYHGVSASA